MTSESKAGQRDQPKSRPTFKPEEPQEEARAYPWDKLTPEQTEAARRVYSLIGGMLEVPYDPDDRAESNPFASLLSPIREDHRNNVILIDGRRGSGKTSLMATILQDLRDELHGSVKGREDLPWAGLVIPVAFLDLHPLPQTSHLLLHLVGRLEWVVKILEDTTSTWANVDAPPWKSPDKSDRPSRQRWRELFEAVIIWKSNLEKRAANLDLDFYAWELGREEARRQEIAVLFRNFVDALCEEVATSAHLRHWMVRRSEKERTFFLIAVDDADLVPHRSVEILDLLRMLWHPRLAFLMTGNSDLFRILLRYHVHGVLKRPLAHIDMPDNQWEMGDDERKITRLADAILDKVIPPVHRCQIQDLSPEQRLKRLAHPLKSIKLKADLALLEAPKPENLFYYFKEEAHATAALPSILRKFRDIERTLERLADEGQEAGEGQTAQAEKDTEYYRRQHRKIASFVRDLWQRLLETEPLTNEEREVLNSVISLDENEMLVVDGFPVRCRYGMRRTYEVWLDELQPAKQPGWRLVIGRDQRLIVSRHRARTRLPDSLKGALELATDLAADIQEYDFVQDSPTPSGFDMAPVVVEWEELEAHRLFRGFAWPLPDWHDFLSFTLFRDSWNKLPLDFLLPLDPAVKDLEILASRYLDIALTVAEDRRSCDSRDIPPALEELSGRVVRLAINRGTSRREQANSAWARGRAGLLATPEAGLPSDIANRWLDELTKAFKNQRIWTRAKKELRDERRQQIRDRWEGSEPNPSLVEEILESIDATSSDFDWIKKIEGNERTSAPASPRSQDRSHKRNAGVT